VSALDTLERQLRDSARRRRLPRLVLAVAALAVAVAAALLALVLVREPSTNPADERPATPTPAATWTPELGDERRGHATISRSPVPPDQLRAFAILRQAPTAADRSPAVRQLLRYLGAEPTRGVRVDAVRLLSQHGNWLLILVPMERLDRPDTSDPLCVLQTVVVRGNPPPGAPPAGSLGGAGMTCATLTDIRRNGYVGWPGPPFGLVPDGVASVKLRVRGGRTINAPVGNNVYDLTGMGDAAFAIQPPLWLDASGHEIPRR
jgi:hypothetical protein